MCHVLFIQSIWTSLRYFTHKETEAKKENIGFAKNHAAGSNSNPGLTPESIS